MIILQVVSLLFWLLVIPFCIGLLPFPLLEKKMRTPGVALVAGYILLFAFLEIVGIPVVLLTVYHGFTFFMWCYTPVLILLAIAGILMAWFENKKAGQKGLTLDFHLLSNWKKMTWEGRIFLFLFLIIMGFQMYMAFTRASFDGDDAYYGAQALIAQKVDSLYRVNPYTGRSSPLDERHSLALFPIWEAFIGRMSGIHATIISHSVVPLVLIPLTYLLYAQIGKLLFVKKKELVPMFMVLLGLWQMFGNISIFTPETFFLTRTWQGKSFAGNFVIPAVFFLFLALCRMEENEKKLGLWILLGFLNLAGGASSSLAVLLSCLLTAGLGVLYAVRDRKFSFLLKAGCSCIPGGLYVLIYLLL